MLLQLQTEQAHDIQRVQDGVCSCQDGVVLSEPHHSLSLPGSGIGKRLS